MSKLFSFDKEKRSIMLVTTSFLTILFMLTGTAEATGVAKAKPAQRAGASIRIDPATLARGGQMIITGAGFLPNEEISLEAVALWKGFDIAIGNIYKCNPSGAFTANVKLPVHKRVNLGLHTLQAFGGEGSVASAGFTVVAEVMNPQNAAVVIVTPNIVTPKGNVTILGSGFAPKEQVSFELVGAWAGFPITVGPLVTCNDFGAFMAKGVTILNRKSLGVFTLRAIGGEGTLATSPIVIEEKKQ